MAGFPDHLPDRHTSICMYPFVCHRFSRSMPGNQYLAILLQNGAIKNFVQAAGERISPWERNMALTRNTELTPAFLRPCNGC